MNVEALLADFEKLLKSHDWYYAYSDDHRYWTAGCESYDKIDKMFRTLREMGYGVESETLFKKYCRN